MMILRIGNKLSGSRRGFTLIEVLMAISILAVGTMSVLRAYSASVTAVERAQYNIDAACILKAAMGGIEEKDITLDGTPPGESSGEFTSSSDIKIDTTRSGRWQWSEEVREIEIKAKTPEEAPASGDAGKKEPEEKEAYFLNEVKLTVVNYERNPSSKVSVMTYMESYDDER